MGIAEKLRALAYGMAPEATSRRDLRLDLLRGYCVLVMVVDHIGGDGSLLYALTGGNRFFVSAAEGFVLISGVAMGTVYAGVIAREGLGGMLWRVLRRVRLLYALTVLLTVTFAMVSTGLGSPWTREITSAAPHEFVVGVVTLRRSYSLTDVMLLYTLLVLAAAPALAFISRGRTAWLLAGSWSLWAAWQLGVAQLQVPWDIVDGGFLFGPWQALFMTGLAVGYHRRALAVRVDRIARRAIVLAAFAAFAALWILYATGLAVPPSAYGPGNLGATGAALFDKDALGAGRVVALAAVAVVAYSLATLAWRPIRGAAGWLLLPLGERALTAYCLHIFVVAAAATPLGAPLHAADHAVAQVAALAVVWGMVRLAQVWAERPLVQRRPLVCATGYCR